MKETIWYKHKLTKSVCQKMKGADRHECNLLFTCKNDALRMLLEQNTNELYYRERWITSYIINTSVLQGVRHLMSSRQG